MSSFWPHDEVDVRIAASLERFDAEVEGVDLHGVLLTKKAADTEAPTAVSTQCGPTLMPTFVAYSSNGRVSTLAQADVT